MQFQLSVALFRVKPYTTLDRHDLGYFGLKLFRIGLGTLPHITGPMRNHSKKSTLLFLRHLLDNSLSAKVNCWDMGGNGVIYYVSMTSHQGFIRIFLSLSTVDIYITM